MGVVLEAIGNYFELESLVVYAISVAAVSHIENQSPVRVVLEDTDGKAWDVMIPLLLANETEPELGIVVDSDADDTGLVMNQFQENVALLFGDYVNYVDTACDYGDDMRVIVTLHLADVTIENVDIIVANYNNYLPFPHYDDQQWLYEQAGRHWGKEGQSLPKHSGGGVKTKAKKRSLLEPDKPHHEGSETLEVGSKYADRFIHGILKTLDDPDCMTGDFDVSAQDFDADDAIKVLRKCKLLVLRNVFDKDFLIDYKEDFARFIKGIHHGYISSAGTTTGSHIRYMQMLDDKRWEVGLPESLAHEDIVMDSDVMNILLKSNILGSDVVLHSLGSAIAEPGAKAQRWHADEYYLYRGLFHTSGLGGHDLPSYAITMMVPLLNMTYDHGPTEFCMGSSFLSGFEGDPDGIKLKDESLRATLRTYMRGSVKGFCPHIRIPQLNFGDALLFDYQIVHRGGANNSPDLRSILYMTYAREWYKDTNLLRIIRPEQYEDERDALYDQLTRSARFAIPHRANPMYDEESEEESLESITEFLPPE